MRTMYVHERVCVKWSVCNVYAHLCNMRVQEKHIVWAHTPFYLSYSLLPLLPPPYPFNLNSLSPSSYLSLPFLSSSLPVVRTTQTRTFHIITCESMLCVKVHVLTRMSCVNMKGCAALQARAKLSRAHWMGPLSAKLLRAHWIGPLTWGYQEGSVPYYTPEHRMCICSRACCVCIRTSGGFVSPVGRWLPTASRSPPWSTKFGSALRNKISDTRTFLSATYAAANSDARVKD